MRVSVRDDGVGSNGATAAGFGLVGLRERAEQLGGKLAFTSAAGEGSALSMEVPG